MSRIVLTASSRVGCVRSNNEDMVFAYDKFIRSDVYRTEFMTENLDRFVIALADGMGGHNAGEVASSDVLHNLQFFVSDLPRNLASREFTDLMEEWLQSVHKIIESKGRTNPEMASMGTTLVALLNYNQKYYWMNCGDSRLYRVRDGQLIQLTVDHSLNTKQSVQRHSNIITNCIGGGCAHSYIDLQDISDDFLPGDTYMLCSDGLNDMVPDAEIERLLVGGATANELCESAIAAGGYDNVSVCVFRIDNAS